MKLNLANKNLLKSALLVAGLALSGSASAGLVNGSFSEVPEFNGWGGDVLYFDGIDEKLDADINFSDFDDNFSTGLNSATLTTSADLVSFNEYFGISLFQEFEVAANSSLLSLTYDSNATIADIISIVLINENGLEEHDFINDVSTYDISSLIGTSVRLEIGIEDGDFVLGDYLTVSNINISKLSMAVPEPSTFAIFALALLGLRSRSITRK